MFLSSGHLSSVSVALILGLSFCFLTAPKNQTGAGNLLYLLVLLASHLSFLNDICTHLEYLNAGVLVQHIIKI